MESTYTKLALYGSKNMCARTDNVFFSHISEVCNGTVSLTESTKNTESTESTESIESTDLQKLQKAKKAQ